MQENTSKEQYSMTQEQYIDLVTTLRQIASDVRAMSNNQAELKAEVSSITKKISLIEGEFSLLREKVKNVETTSSEKYKSVDKTIADIQVVLKEEEERKGKFWSKTGEKIINWVVPFVFFIIGLILAKLGILNLK